MTARFLGDKAKSGNLPPNEEDFRLSLYHSITVFFPTVNPKHKGTAIPLTEAAQIHPLTPSSSPNSSGWLSRTPSISRRFHITQPITQKPDAPDPQSGPRRAFKVHLYCFLRQHRKRYYMLRNPVPGIPCCAWAPRPLFGNLPQNSLWRPISYWSR